MVFIRISMVLHMVLHSVCRIAARIWRWPVMRLADHRDFWSQFLLVLLMFAAVAWVLFLSLRAEAIDNRTVRLAAQTAEVVRVYRSTGVQGLVQGLGPRRLDVPSLSSSLLFSSVTGGSFRLVVATRAEGGHGGHDDDGDSAFSIGGLSDRLFFEAEERDLDDLIFIPLAETKGSLLPPHEAPRHAEGEHEFVEYEFVSAIADQFGLFVAHGPGGAEGQGAMITFGYLGRIIHLPQGGVLAVLDTQLVPVYPTFTLFYVLIVFSLVTAFASTRLLRNDLATLSLGLATYINREDGASRHATTHAGAGEGAGEGEGASPSRALLTAPRRLFLPQGSARAKHLTKQINGVLEEMAAASDQMRLQSNRIAHDLRTPLTNLFHLLEELRDACEGTPNEPLVDRAIDKVRSMQGGFDGILRLTRLEGQAVLLVRQQVDLVAVIREQIEFFSMAAENEGIDIVLCPPQQPVISCSIDLSLYQIAFSNIFDNAMRYAKQQVTLTIECSYLDPQGRPHACDGLLSGVCITVYDDGPGIAAADWEKIFAPFWRADPSRSSTLGKQLQQGDALHLGIGLAMVQSVMALHHGQVTATRHPETGEFGIAMWFPIASLAV